MECSISTGLAARPTASLEAYDAFLKGEAASGGLSMMDPPSLNRALPHYRQATTLDSSFIPAWARLSRVYSTLYANASPRPEWAAQALNAAQRARRLGPDRPEAFLAMGAYQLSVLRDLDQAAATYQAGLRLAPNDLAMIGSTAAIEMTRGNWEEAVALRQQIVARDPRSAPASRGSPTASSSSVAIPRPRPPRSGPGASHPPT